MLPNKQTQTYTYYRFFQNHFNIVLDAQIKECNTKLSTTPNTYDESHNITNTLPTAPQLPSLNCNHPLPLVPRNFRNLALVNFANSRPNHIQSPIHRNTLYLHTKLTRQKTRTHYFQSTNRHPSLRIISR